MLPKERFGCSSCHLSSPLAKKSRLEPEGGREGRLPLLPPSPAVRESYSDIRQAPSPSWCHLPPQAGHPRDDQGGAEGQDEGAGQAVGGQGGGGVQLSGTQL